MNSTYNFVSQKNTTSKQVVKREDKDTKTEINERQNQHTTKRTKDRNCFLKMTNTVARQVLHQWGKNKLLIK